jgi:hypothetical protein
MLFAFMDFERESVAAYGDDREVRCIGGDRPDRERSAIDLELYGNQMKELLEEVRSFLRIRDFRAAAGGEAVGDDLVLRVFRV